MEETQYSFNHRGVCVNSEVVYFKAAKNLRYVKIEICCYQGKWDYGFFHPNACSPCTNEGDYLNKENAIQDAISLIKELFDEDHALGDLQELKKHFLEWVNLRSHPTLF